MTETARFPMVAGRFDDKGTSALMQLEVVPRVWRPAEALEGSCSRDALCPSPSCKGLGPQWDRSTI
jgi:hypothetical protein